MSAISQDTLLAIAPIRDARRVAVVLVVVVVVVVVVGVPVLAPHDLALVLAVVVVIVEKGAVAARGLGLLPDEYHQSENLQFDGAEAEVGADAGHDPSARMHVFSISRVLG